MKGLFAVLLMFAVASPCLCARITACAGPSFNVVNYGAKGNGQNDDSQAFVKAWQEVCSATQGTPTLLIPEGKKFMVQPVSFLGPCKAATINIELRGTITAPNNVNAWKWPSNEREAWLHFSGIRGLAVSGGGQIDGQGASWWNCNSNGNCDRPVALHFHDCEDLHLSHLTHINSPRSHISLNACNGSRISHLHIIAPEESPNTDGINIGESSNVIIEQSKMETGDDCIAINDASSYINITGILCGPGHGISVGSLGKNGAHESVEEIHVRNCTFRGTSNGGRIKTWEGGSGYARKITFENIVLEAARNPVIIDQQYNPGTNGEQNAVIVSDVTYSGIRGTSANEEVIQLHCDSSIGCTNIVLDQINIASVTGKKTYASCINAQGRSTSSNPEVPCLK